MLRRIGHETKPHHDKSFDKFTSFQNHKDLKEHLLAIRIIDNSGWLSEGIELPDLPQLQPEAIERLKTLLKHQVEFNLAGKVVKYSLSEFLQLIVHGKRRGRIQLVGGELKKVLGNAWFNDALQTLDKEIQLEVPFTDETEDVDVRFIIEDGTPSNVVAIDFLKSLIATYPQKQQRDLLPNLEIEFQYGYFSNNNSALLSNGRLDLYICPPGNHSTLTNEDLVLDITDFLSDENIPLRPFGCIRKGWQAVLASGMKLIQVTEVNRSTWSRAMYKLFKGWNYSTLAQEVYSKMNAEMLILKTKYYFSTKISSPQSQFLFLLLTTADLMSQNMPAELVKNYYHTLKTEIKPIPEATFAKVRELLDTTPIDLAISALKIESEKILPLKRFLSPLNLKTAVRILAGYDANNLFPLKLLFHYFDIEYQNSLSVKDKLPFILVQKFAPQELEHLINCYSEEKQLSQTFFVSAIELLIKDNLIIPAADFFSMTIHKVRIGPSNISQTLSDLASVLLAPKDEASLIERVSLYIKMIKACLTKTAKLKKELGERLRNDICLLMNNKAPLLALDLLVFSTENESLILREPSLWLNALQAYSNMPDTNWHAVFRYWQIGQKFDLWGAGTLPGPYVLFFTRFLTQLFRGTSEEAQTAFTYFERMGVELLQKASAEMAKALTIAKNRREESIRKGSDSVFYYMEQLKAKKIQTDEFETLVNLLKDPSRKDPLWEQRINQFIRLSMDYLVQHPKTAAFLQKPIISIATSEKTLRFSHLLIEAMKQGPLCHTASKNLLIWLTRIKKQTPELTSALLSSSNELILALLTLKHSFDFLPALEVLIELKASLDPHTSQILSILLSLCKKSCKDSVERKTILKHINQIISMHRLEKSQFQTVLAFTESLIADRHFEDGILLLSALFPEATKKQMNEVLFRTLSILDNALEHQKALCLIEQIQLHFPEEKETISELFGALTEGFYFHSIAKTAELAPVHINHEQNERVFAKMVQSDSKSAAKFLDRGYCPSDPILNELLISSKKMDNSELRIAVWTVARRRFNSVYNGSNDSLDWGNNLGRWDSAFGLLSSFQKCELNAVIAPLEEGILSIRRIEDKRFCNFTDVDKHTLALDFFALLNARLSAKPAPSEEMLCAILREKRRIYRLNKNQHIMEIWSNEEKKLAEILSSSSSFRMFFKGWKAFRKLPYPSKKEIHTKNLYLAFLKGFRKFPEQKDKMVPMIETITERIWQRHTGYSLSEQDFSAIAKTLSKHPIFEELMQNAPSSKRLYFLEIKQTAETLSANEDIEYRKLLWKEFFSSIGRIIASKSTLSYYMVLLPLLYTLRSFPEPWCTRMTLILFTFSITLCRKDAIGLLSAFLLSLYMADLNNKMLKAEL